MVLSNILPKIHNRKIGLKSDELVAHFVLFKGDGRYVFHFPKLVCDGKQQAYFSRNITLNYY